MKGLVYAGVGQPRVEERPKPTILKPTDAIVKIVQTTICGTDLHIFKGDVPTCKVGTILGHEGIAIVEQVGESVKNFKPGDKVIIACITSCTTCYYCRRAMPSHCVEGGWMLGNVVDGTQAEYTRIPHADGSLHHTPKGVTDEELLLLSDAVPTGYECGVLQGKVQIGSTVAIVGSGPVGLGALITSHLYNPSKIIMIDLSEKRLTSARSFGATHTVISGPDTVKQVMELTNDKGVDVVIEAVGMPKSFELCQELVAAGGTIANLGVHGKKVDLHLEKLWDRNICITTRVLDAVSTPMLIQLVDSGKIQLGGLITHRFAFDEIVNAYSTSNAAEAHDCLKVAIQL
ncbi:hypothetical protein GYMLUDRAFT_180468 [Collybiopsis luxurians FD-317 M1]|uniref:Unplaced genomic scaffold GYMLUscaffold_100, whole genome shotgun sequence n=1 Tax=Collybiopsis luxurians FD-317 M1 TaxID=944289 RepID=A0A0D0APF5_9AGAR|nr:hypothetical protein GYMLUDRAFT_180468 [Collybiopsis luxurians FD-317 M1]